MVRKGSEGVYFCFEILSSFLERRSEGRYFCSERLCFIVEHFPRYTVMGGTVTVTEGGSSAGHHWVTVIVGRVRGGRQCVTLFLCAVGWGLGMGGGTIRRDTYAV